jgi:hypothetical protein
MSPFCRTWSNEGLPDIPLDAAAIAAHGRAMKLFSCDHCQQTLFFENNRCVSCGDAVGYAPDIARLVTLRPAAADANVYEVAMPNNEVQRYRQCRNTRDYDACNWLVPAASEGEYCQSCVLSEVIPDLSVPANDAAWRRIEAAKRRLLYTLYALRLPVEGLSFKFLKGTEDEPVMTGHEDGVITLNVDEADFAFRENMREKMGEAYRTVLGHLRHEIGHYYWDRLIADAGKLDLFRGCFGDETASYEEALERHYQYGPHPNWGEWFISAYASMHPWEDFAETWAHYLHMVDTLETAKSHGLTVRMPATDKPAERIVTDRLAFFDFEALVSGWNAVTLAMNSLNRSMGMKDAYPFVLTPAVLGKLRFVHELVQSQRRDQSQPTVNVAA